MQIDWKQLRGAKGFWCAAYLLGALAGLLITASLLYVTGWVTFAFASRLAVLVLGPYLLTVPLIWRLARKFPLEKGRWRRPLWVHLGCMVGFVVVCEVLQVGLAVMILGMPPPAKARFDAPPARRLQRLELPPLPPGEGETLRPPMLGGLPPMKAPFNLPIYWLIVSVAHLVRYSTKLRQREQQQVLLQAELTEARLQALQTQLQPHFLFNTLNSISAHIREQPAVADEMVSNLADLLRATLEQEQEPETTLENELRVLGFYLEIQRVRFGERLRLELIVPPELRDALVPTFILQPLVENAIQHGIGQHSEDGVVTVQASRTGDRLQLRVADNGGGLPPSLPPAPVEGIGLGNTRTRLRTLYGEQCRLDLHRSTAGGMCVGLEIPWHRALPMSARSPEPQGNPGAS